MSARISGSSGEFKSLWGSGASQCFLNRSPRTSPSFRTLVFAKHTSHCCYHTLAAKRSSSSCYHALAATRSCRSQRNLALHHQQAASPLTNHFIQFHHQFTACDVGLLSRSTKGTAVQWALASSRSCQSEVMRLGSSRREVTLQRGVSRAWQRGTTLPKENVSRCC
jgi:hypothetical protein